MNFYANFGDIVTVHSTLYRTEEGRTRVVYASKEKPQPYKLWKEKKITPREAIIGTNDDCRMA